MHKKKLIIIYTIFICIVFGFTACSTNKTVQKKEEVKIKYKNPPVNKNIGIEQQLNSNKLPLQSPLPSPKVIVKDKVVARFCTKLLDTDKDRIYNIYRSSKKINNYILKPDEVFSFNQIVGRREYKKGYKKAKILVNGEGDEGIGGGICQLSSTIYNAAEKLGLKIIERHSHSGNVYYVPMGHDAAVNYGYKDLKFRNTKEYSIKFKIRMTKRKLYVSILKVN
jgi:hypothetical protein